MTIRFEGLDEVLSALDKLADEARYEAAMGTACAVVERAAKQNAPKATGNLRNSITSEVTNEGGDIVGSIFTPTEYAPYVEYGTGLFAEGGGRTDVPWTYQADNGDWITTYGQHPQPFMRPAMEQSRDEIISILRGVIKDG